MATRRGDAREPAPAWAGVLLLDDVPAPLLFAVGWCMARRDGGAPSLADAATAARMTAADAARLRDSLLASRMIAADGTPQAAMIVVAQELLRSRLRLPRRRVEG